MSNEEYTHQSFAKESTMDAMEKVFSRSGNLEISPIDLTLTPAMERTIKLHEEGHKAMMNIAGVPKKYIN